MMPSLACGVVELSAFVSGWIVQLLLTFSAVSLLVGTGIMTVDLDSKVGTCLRVQGW